jgi:hypothetical protein
VKRAGRVAIGDFFDRIDHLQVSNLDNSVNLRAAYSLQKSNWRKLETVGFYNIYMLKPDPVYFQPGE